MIFDVQDRSTYADTGEKAFDPALPTWVFIHGALNDHSVWAPQIGSVAQHGFNVLAPDLPGHGRSQGPALETVEALAEWLLAALDAAGAAQATLIGHSMGSLIALEACLRAPQRVSALALLGSSYPMKVSAALLGTARDDEAAAIEMVSQWSHAPAAQAAGLAEASKRLMQRMAALNPQHLLYTDLNACNAYANGEAAARAVSCPALFVLGSQDRMTPPKSARLLTAAIAHATVVQVDAGHQMMAEQPGAVLNALLQLANCSARV